MSSVLTCARCVADGMLRAMIEAGSCSKMSAGGGWSSGEWLLANPKQVLVYRSRGVTSSFALFQLSIQVLLLTVLPSPATKACPSRRGSFRCELGS